MGMTPDLHLKCNLQTRLLHILFSPTLLPWSEWNFLIFLHCESSYPWKLLQEEPFLPENARTAMRRQPPLQTPVFQVRCQYLSE